MGFRKTNKLKKKKKSSWGEKIKKKKSRNLFFQKNFRLTTWLVANILSITCYIQHFMAFGAYIWKFQSF